MAKQKLKLKHIFVYRHSATTITYNIAFLTTDLQYVDFEFILRSKSLTQSVSYRLRQLFVDFQITDKTSVVLFDTIDFMSPFYFYFAFIHQHIPFSFRVASTDQIVRRISTYHRTFFSKKPSQINRKYFNRLWVQLIKHDVCPWITKDINYQLMNLSSMAMRRNQILRIGLYYMSIKEYLMRLKNRKHNVK